MSSPTDQWPFFSELLKFPPCGRSFLLPVKDNGWFNLTVIPDKDQHLIYDFWGLDGGRYFNTAVAPSIETPDPN